MFCKDSCEHAPCSDVCSKQQFIVQQQTAPVTTAITEQLTAIDGFINVINVDRREELPSVGMCFVTEKSEGLSIDCDVPISNSYNVESFNHTPVRLQSVEPNSPNIYLAPPMDTYLSCSQDLNLNDLCYGFKPQSINIPTTTPTPAAAPISTVIACIENQQELLLQQQELIRQLQQQLEQNSLEPQSTQQTIYSCIDNQPQQARLKQEPVKDCAYLPSACDYIQSTSSPASPVPVIQPHEEQPMKLTYMCSVVPPPNDAPCKKQETQTPCISSKHKHHEHQTIVHFDLPVIAKTSKCNHLSIQPLQKQQPCPISSSCPMIDIGAQKSAAQSNCLKQINCAHQNNAWTQAQQLQQEQLQNQQKQLCSVCNNNRTENLTYVTSFNQKNNCKKRSGCPGCNCWHYSRYGNWYW